MIRLNLQKEPYWLELPAEVKIKVYPLSTAIMNAAQSMVIKQIRELPETTEQNRLAISQMLLIRAMAISSIIEWQGVFAPAGDELAIVDEQNIKDLMDIWFIGQAFWEKYTTSFMILETEGNGSRPAAHGTLAAGQDTVGVATKKACRVAKVKKAS